MAALQSMEREAPRSPETGAAAASLTLAVADTDSTLVYYRMHARLVAPSTVLG